MDLILHGIRPIWRCLILFSVMQPNESSLLHFCQYLYHNFSHLLSVSFCMFLHRKARRKSDRRVVSLYYSIRASLSLLLWFSYVVWLSILYAKSPIRKPLIHIHDNDARTNSTRFIFCLLFHIFAHIACRPRIFAFRFTVVVALAGIECNRENLSAFLWVPWFSFSTGHRRHALQCRPCILVLCLAFLMGEASVSFFIVFIIVECERIYYICVCIWREEKKNSHRLNSPEIYFFFVFVVSRLVLSFRSFVLLFPILSTFLLFLNIFCGECLRISFSFGIIFFLVKFTSQYISHSNTLRNTFLQPEPKIEKPNVKKGSRKILIFV